MPSPYYHIAEVTVFCLNTMQAVRHGHCFDVWRYKHNPRSPRLLLTKCMLTTVAVFAFVSLAKYSTSTAADFETLYTHTQEFITTCNGEHVRCATDMCEYVSYFFSK